MMRRARLERTPEVIEGFRMRGIEVSRMEAFADGVFGFGLTLLGVVSLQVPTTYAEVVAALRGFIPFGLCFAIFYGIWVRHYTYCRRYGLEDIKVLVLTACMLFVVLAYLYPLRFLATLFVSFVLHLDTGAIKVKAMSLSDFSNLFIVYGAGYALIQYFFYMLYLHAYKSRAKLQLDELETLDTKWWAIEQAMYLTIPLGSILIAALAPPNLVGLAGWIYFFMGFVGWLHGSMHGKRHRALAARMTAEGKLFAAEMNAEDALKEISG